MKAFSIQHFNDSKPHAFQSQSHGSTDFKLVLVSTPHLDGRQVMGPSPRAHRRRLRLGAGNAAEWYDLVVVVVVVVVVVIIVLAHVNPNPDGCGGASGE